MQKFIDSSLFNDFTYSKRSHFELFIKNNYDNELYCQRIDPDYCDLKVYQDLLVFSFIKQSIEPGSKILDIGGGASRILTYFKNEFECWNIDKLEGIGNGPTEIDSTGFKLVNAYIGEFTEDLPENYFDLAFSISTFEHITLDDTRLYDNILKDINRVLKSKGYSLHCLDHCTDLLIDVIDEAWTNPIIPYFFENENIINDFVPIINAERDPELFVMSEKFYNDNWQFTTGVAYENFGKPFSYNFLWRKP